MNHRTLIGTGRIGAVIAILTAGLIVCEGTLDRAGSVLTLTVKPAYGPALPTITPWPGGVVPYQFPFGAIALTSDQEDDALTAMAEIEAVCGVRFVPFTNQWNRIIFEDTSNYSTQVNESAVGMQSDPQYVRIGNWAKYTICHELMHALGFVHEHSRPDRDCYVSINWGVVGTSCGLLPGTSNCSHNFELQPDGWVTTPYDFDSIMHYLQTAWSQLPGMNTIDVLPMPCNASFWPASADLIGQRVHLSLGDALKLRTKYGPPSPPSIIGAFPVSAEQGSTSSATVTVYGSGFLEGGINPNGSSNTNGVLGTRVLFDGAPLPTQYESPGEVTATISAFLLNNAGCHTLTAENPSPGGGESANSIMFHVTATGSQVDVFVGNDQGDRLGTSVAGMGDVDGDGHADVLVGAPEACGGKGVVTCFSGATGERIWIAMGAEGEEFGYAVASIGDVTGDGVGEAVIGGPGYASRGRIHVVDGSTGSAYEMRTGPSQSSRFGVAVSRAGDVNGDGVPDFVVGSPGHDDGRGQVTIRSGDDATVIDTVDGEQVAEWFGLAVDGGVDVTGDGNPDVVVGAPYYGSNLGRVRVIDLASTGGSTSSANQISPFLYGGANNDRFGTSVALCPPTTGTGAGHILVGAPQSGSTSPNAPAKRGYVQVFGSWAVTVGPLQTTGEFPQIATFVGDAPTDCFGRAVCGAGDLDQDGHEDIVVGADQDPIYPTAAIGNGYVRVISGRTHEVLRDFTPSQSGARFGAAVARAGDTDADASPDLLIGAPRWDESGLSNCGRANIIHAPMPPSYPRVLITEMRAFPKTVEVTNFGSTTVSLSGWSVLWDAGSPVSSGSLGVSIDPGESVIVTRSSASLSGLPAGTKVVATLPPVQDAGLGDTIGLVNGGGLVVDELRVSNPSGQHHGRSAGGCFRGLALRGNLASLGNVGGVERLWGLDSNSGSDWTEQVEHSLGRESTSSGPRGTDPIPLPDLVINEIDTVQIGPLNHLSFVELRHVGIDTLVLQDWYIRGSRAQGGSQQILSLFEDAVEIPSGGFIVLGEGSNPPAELPSYVTYVDVGLSSLPWRTDESDCALYDAYGRLIDLVRLTGHGDERVHNHPRAPSHWADFVGGARRSGPGLGRDITSTDTGSGVDWWPTPIRTMGAPNLLTGNPGHGDALDVRVNETGRGEGLTVIINAGSSHAGATWSFLLSLFHSDGVGPNGGLGALLLPSSALGPGFSGTLDDRGSARIDLDPGTFSSGAELDVIFVVDEGSGALQTLVLEFDT